MVKNYTYKNYNMQEKNILQEAEGLIYGDRQEAYGSVSDNFRNIAAMWSVIAKTTITEEQVGLMMVSLKICRQLHAPKRDNLVDGAGYFGCIDKMEREKAAAPVNKGGAIKKEEQSIDGLRETYRALMGWGPKIHVISVVDAVRHIWQEAKCVLGSKSNFRIVNGPAEVEGADQAEAWRNAWMEIPADVRAAYVIGNQPEKIEVETIEDAVKHVWPTAMWATVSMTPVSTEPLVGEFGFRILNVPNEPEAYELEEAWYRAWMQVSEDIKGRYIIRRQWPHNSSNPSEKILVECAQEAVCSIWPHAKIVPSGFGGEKGLMIVGAPIVAWGSTEELAWQNSLDVTPMYIR